MKVFSTGIFAIGIASSAAVLTTPIPTNSFHYIQKPVECKPIPITDCSEYGSIPCYVFDEFGNYRVYKTQLSAEECEIPLFSE